MREIKHTPGPWYAQGIHVESEDKTIAECALALNGRGVPGLDEMENNACLIAAAPELLKACVAIAEAIRQENTEKYVFEDDWNPEAHLEGITLTIRDARLVYAALARARGEVIR